MDSKVLQRRFFSLHRWIFFILLISLFHQNFVCADDASTTYLQKEGTISNQESEEDELKSEINSILNTENTSFEPGSDFPRKNNLEGYREFIFLNENPQKQTEENWPSKGRNKLARAVKRYNIFLEKNYYLASFFQGSILGSFGDVLAQYIENKHLQKTDYKRAWFDKRRAFEMTVLSTLIDGLLTPRYYDLLEVISTKKTLGVVAVKALIGSIVWGPLANGAFLAGIPLMRHGLNVPSHYSFSTFKHQLKLVTIRDLQIWPIFDLISFSFLPKHWRPLFGNLAGISIISLSGLISLLKSWTMDNTKIPSF